ncbi:MAG: hypothetical protein WDW36_001553 [Sanguina aurantia]
MPSSDIGQSLMHGELLDGAAHQQRVAGGSRTRERPLSSRSATAAAWKAYGSPVTRGAAPPPPVQTDLQHPSPRTSVIQAMLSQAPKAVKMGGGFWMGRPHSAPAHTLSLDPPQSRPQPPARSYTATTTDGAKLTARTGSGASGNGLSPVAASTGGGISSPSPHPWRAGHHRTRPVSAAPALQQVAPPQSRAAGEAFRFSATLPTAASSKRLYESQMQRAERSLGLPPRGQASALSATVPKLNRGGSGGGGGGGSGGGGGGGSGGVSSKGLHRSSSGIPSASQQMISQRFASSSIGSCQLLGSQLRPFMVSGFSEPHGVLSVPQPQDSLWCHSRLGATQLQQLQRTLKSTEPLEPARMRPKSAPSPTAAGPSKLKGTGGSSYGKGEGKPPRAKAGFSSLEEAYGGSTNGSSSSKGDGAKPRQRAGFGGDEEDAGGGGRKQSKPRQKAGFGGGDGVDEDQEDGQSEVLDRSQGRRKSRFKGELDEDGAGSSEGLVGERSSGVRLHALGKSTAQVRAGFAGTGGQARTDDGHPNELAIMEEAGDTGEGFKRLISVVGRAGVNSAPQGEVDHMRLSSYALSAQHSNASTAAAAAAAAALVQQASLHDSEGGSVIAEDPDVDSDDDTEFSRQVMPGPTRAMPVSLTSSDAQPRGLPAVRPLESSSALTSRPPSRASSPRLQRSFSIPTNTNATDSTATLHVTGSRSRPSSPPLPLSSSHLGSRGAQRGRGSSTGGDGTAAPDSGGSVAVPSLAREGPAVVHTSETAARTKHRPQAAQPRRGLSTGTARLTPVIVADTTGVPRRPVSQRRESEGGGAGHLDAEGDDGDPRRASSSSLLSQPSDHEAGATAAGPSHTQHPPQPQPQTSVHDGMLSQAYAGQRDPEEHSQARHRHETDSGPACHHPSQALDALTDACVQEDEEGVLEDFGEGGVWGGVDVLSTIGEEMESWADLPDSIPRSRSSSAGRPQSAARRPSSAVGIQAKQQPPVAGKA